MVKTILALLCICVLVAGCTLFFEPKRPDDIATYNNQMFQLLMSIVTFLGIVATAVGGWMKSNKDKAELAQTHRTQATILAKDAEARTEKVQERFDEAKNYNVAAIETSNGLNEKIVSLQAQLDEALKARARGRRTDPQTPVVPVPVDLVQKVQVVAGPGVDSALKVTEDTKRRKDDH